MWNYDPQRVTVTVGGSTITGFVKGSSIKVTREADVATDEVGREGEVVVVRTLDRRGTIELKLMSASPSNDILAAMAQAMELGDTTNAIKAVQVADGNSSSTIHHAQKAWIKKMADAEYSTEATERTWEVRCERLEHFVAGQTPT